MRSTFSGLNTMVRGIFTNQLSLDTTGHNITNADTDGYSRQKVRQATTTQYRQPTMYGGVLVGTGVDAAAVSRARNLYADKQFWQTNSLHEYYKVLQTNFDKVESVFDDSDDSGVQNYLERFFKAWQDVSTSASASEPRVAVLEQATNLVSSLQTAAANLQQEIKFQYQELLNGVTEVNEITDRVVKLNKAIMVQESTGGEANDLRDQRDLEVDKLSEYMNVTVYEDELTGMYRIVTEGLTLVDGHDRATFQTRDTKGANTTGVYYGVEDHYVEVKESKTIFEMSTGKFKAYREAINTDKEYIDHLANIAAFLLSTFNTQHQQGAGIDDEATTGQNFFGNANTVYSYEWNEDLKATTIKATQYNGVVYDSEKDEEVYEAGLFSVRQIKDIDPDDSSAGQYVEVTSSGRGEIIQREDIHGNFVDTLTLSGIQIVNALSVSTLLTDTGGYKLVAAREWNIDTSGNIVSEGVADGKNAVWLSTLFNTNQSDTGYAVRGGVSSSEYFGRSIGSVSLNKYYENAMSGLGSVSESVDINEDAYDNILEQVVNWRSSTAGVDWNEELTNMLTFQKGFIACSRCLTTMDEMLDRLINNTGLVGR